MANYKATYICSTRSKYDRKYYTQHWEYRGISYMVTMPADGNPSSDYIYGDMKPTAQHRREQAAIDEMLDHPETAEPKEYTGEAEKALDDMFQYLDQ